MSRTKYLKHTDAGFALRLLTQETSPQDTNTDRGTKENGAEECIRISEDRGGYIGRGCAMIDIIPYPPPPGRKCGSSPRVPRSRFPDPGNGAQLSGQTEVPQKELNTPAEDGIYWLARGTDLEYERRVETNFEELD